MIVDKKTWSFFVLFVLELPFLGSNAVAQLDMESMSVSLPQKIHSLVVQKVDPEHRLMNFDQFAPTVQRLFDKGSSSLPMATLGDFDGDEKMDIALMGYTGSGSDKGKATVFVFAITDYLGAAKFIEIQRPKQVDFDLEHQFSTSSSDEPVNEKGLNFYLSRLEKQNLSFPVGEVKSDVLQLELWGASATRAVVIRNGKVVPSPAEYRRSAR